MFFVKPPTKIVILSGAPADLSRATALLARSRRPVPSAAEGTPAVLILPMQLGGFWPPKPENRVCDTYSGHGVGTACAVAFSWQPFLKFDIFGCFWGLAAQRGWAKGFFFIEKPSLMSGTEAQTGT